MNSKINFIENEIASLRKELNAHSLYKNFEDIEDIKIFMESHVFAVWDFMSLLKALQINLTSVSLPWFPKGNSNLVRFINEITLAEESDLDKDGVVKSHFEMYLDAMKEMGANTNEINCFIDNLKSSSLSVSESLETTKVINAVKDFVNFTFDIISSKQLHKIASAFTFGREDVIPDMFLNIVNKSSSEDKNYDSFIYYLNRHIELDGDEHGPLSLQMVSELCGDNEQKWDEVLEVAKKSLEVRINLWIGIEEEILKGKTEIGLK
ncbi:DUF3050 domain-containing protein [Polaribacter sp.]|uniref:DUF3050 domain-containing protein n=1 Tax=Polaribacter sp. TaxID=1920175 RepID=UPI003F6C153E